MIHGKSTSGDDALIAALDACKEKLAEAGRDPSVTTLTRVFNAIRALADVVGPWVGADLGVRYRAAFETWNSAIERHVQLTATLSRQKSIDETDAAMLLRLENEETTARADCLKVAMQIGVALDAALALKRARKN